MSPIWKVRRELWRMTMQIGHLPWLIFAPIAKRLYDQRKGRILSITKGEMPQTDEIAILLLFQPKGIVPSTLHTLDHFRSRGISTLVVSNAPLSKVDRTRLCSHAWRIMERPNYGYDFGGYRDGILHLLDLGLRPSRLYVLNDSIWFPLREDSDLVDDVRASEADLYGFVLNDRMRGNKRQHIQSYFFSFGGRLIAHPYFETHWRNIFLTNNKNLVVRRCEIPMTEAFQSRGHSVAFRHTYGDGARALRKLDNESLRRVIAYQSKVSTRTAKRLQRHLVDEDLDDVWRARVLKDIDTGIMDKYFLIAHPAVLIEQICSPIIKKDRQDIYRLQRHELLASRLEETFAPCVRDEVRNWDRNP